MKTLTYASIKELAPCYDPIKYIPVDWSGSVIDILSMKNIPARDRLWVAVRNQLMSQDHLKKFGLFCARQCEMYSTDPRVKLCNDTTQAYLQGEVTLEQLKKARYAANVAAAYAANAYAANAANAAAAYAANAASREEQCLYLIELLGGI